MHQLWSYLSDVWGKLDEESRNKIEGVWSGVELAAIELYADLYHYISSLSLEKIVYYRRVYHRKFALDQPVGSEVKDVPVLQDHLRTPYYTYVQGEDFTIDQDGYIDFGAMTPQKMNLLTGANEDATELFAPYIHTENSDIWSYAIAVGLSRSAVASWSTPRVFETVKAMANAYVNGATIANMKRALAVLLDLPYSPVTGTIKSKTLDTGVATIIFEDGEADIEYSFNCSAGEFASIISGNVNKYDLLIPGMITIGPEDIDMSAFAVLSKVSVDPNLVDLTTEITVPWQAGDIIEVRNVSKSLSDFVTIAEIDGNSLTASQPVKIPIESGDVVIVRRGRPTVDEIRNYNEISIDVVYSENPAANQPVQDFLARLKNPRSTFTLIISAS